MNFLNFLAARGAALSRRRWLAAAGLGTLVTACGGGSDDGADALLERLQSQASKLVSQGVVGAATGWTDSTRAQVAVAGLRRLGGTAALERGDVMAIGSNTKAMTACVAASVVDQGLLRWDSTLAQTLSGLAREALPAYQNSGIPFRAWLLRVATNRANAVARRERVRRRARAARPPHRGQI